MNSAKPTHFHSIDSLRGIAALAVCFYHFTGGFLSKDNILTVANQYGYLGVDAFYVISGFVIPFSFAIKNYQITQFWSFFKKRFVRIEPAYWVSIVLIMFKEVTSRLVQDYRYFEFPHYTFAGIGAHFLHLNDFFNLPWLQQVYWTLAIDWQFFIFIGLIFFWVNRPEWWARYALYIFFIAVKWLFDPDSTKQWLFYHITLFLPGLIFFHYKKGYIQKIEFYILMAVALYAIWYKMWWNHLAATLFSVLIIESFTKEFKITSYMGKISYSMYLTHIFSGWWVTAILMNVAHTEGPKTLAVLIGIAVSIGFAKLYYDYIEKPTQEWARKV
jgi:peptidoglycan/LPS O-acetylase OafA/YrhL